MQGRTNNSQRTKYPWRFSLAVACALALWGTVPCAGTHPTPEWNPTLGPPAGAKYVGDAVCAECHVAEAKTFPSAPMEQAGAWARDAAILKAHPKLTFRWGPYIYRIVRQGNGSIYSVSEGKRTISVPILWAFGRGEAGQTYLFRYQGAYYQSMVSFYNDTQRLDITLGAPRRLPPSLSLALGARLTEQGARLCIACHTTGALIGGRFHPRRAVPGVHCEACHGPGGAHLAALQAGNIAQAKRAIFNPGKLSAGRLDDFCGDCHRSWMKVELMGVRGVRNVRFQPYRLELSHCWSPTDPRISCLACHNPHQPLETSEAFYDSKCLACHLVKGQLPNAQHPGRACPVSTSHCIACHMQKYQLPGGHFAFTDHDIRIVKPGAPYPG